MHREIDSLIRRKNISLWILLCSLILAACQQKHVPAGKDLLAVVDDLKRDVRFRNFPRRIISLAPSITETLFALNADSLIAGVTSYCDYPAAAKRKTKVGDLVHPSSEAIISAQPDLIIMTVEGNTQQTFEDLSRLGLNIFMTNPRTIQGVMKSITDLGKITRMEARAKLLVDSVQSLIDRRESAQSAPKPSVLMFVSFEPLMVVGRNSFIDELITQAGGLNIASNAKSTYPVLNREEIVQRNPDIILIPDDINIPFDEIRAQYPEWRFVNAVKHKNVFYVDANVLQRPGPRIIDGLKLLKKIFKTKELEGIN